VTSHSITLTNLKPRTKYYYQVESNYTYGSDVIPATSTILSFAAQYVMITNVYASLLSTSSVTITWTTDVNSDSRVEYAQCELKDAQALWTMNGFLYKMGDGITKHTVTLTGLQVDKTYAFRVKSTYLSDSTVYSYSSFSSFRTSLSITNGPAWTATSTSLTITWSTNLASNTRVYYGTTPSYANQLTGSDGTAHTVTITGLISNTQYHFKVQSRDIPDMTMNISSPDQVARTTGLMISKVTSFVTGPTSAIINWTTNIAASGKVDYGLTTGYGLVKNQVGTSTTHSLTLTSLLSSNTYHFKVSSTSTSNASDQQVSADSTFLTTTYPNDDAGSHADAGNSFAAAMMVESSSIIGNVTYSSDSYDFYKFYAFTGQTINVTLTVSSGINLNLYLYDPAGTQRASSTKGTGLSEAISFLATSEGFWRFEVRWISGSGKLRYYSSLHIFEAANSYNLDVGTTGDNYPNNHMPGLLIANSTGWGSPSSSNGITYRQGVAGSGILLNLDSESQSRDYQITLRYYSGPNVVVSMRTPVGWTNVTTLKGSTSWNASSFILSSDLFYDYMPNLNGLNVRLNFSGALQLDTASAVAVSSDRGVNDYGNGKPDPRPDLPFYRLESGWSVNGWLANGSVGATLTVAVPRNDVDYLVRFSAGGISSGTEVQQYTATGYKGIGQLVIYGQEAVVVLNREWYYDTNTSTPWKDIRIMLTAPLRNLSSVGISPALFTNDVGTSGDSVIASYNPGICIANNSEWGTINTQNGRTYRVGTAGASFYLNSPISGTPYQITLTYMTSSSGYVRQWNGKLGGVDQWVNLAPLIADGIWHQVSFATLPSIYQDYLSYSSELNVHFELTCSASVDWINASADNDNDSLSTFQEAFRSYEHDSVAKLSGFSKTFSCWTLGNYSVSLKMALQPGVWWEGIRNYVDWIAADITLDGGSKVVLNTTGVNLNTTVYFNRTLSQGQHTISVAQRGGGSLVTSDIVIRSGLELNPFSADSDSDGLTDGQELAMGTNPAVADTDHDGLSDGQEKYSVQYSTDKAKSIVEDPNQVLHTDMSVKVRGVVGPLDRAMALVGIMHERIGDLRVFVMSPGGSSVELFHDSGNLSTSLFANYDLLPTFGAAAFAQDGNWTLKVYDVRTGSVGRIDYFRVQIDGQTDPLCNDSDHDGIPDGEEVNLGADGFVTNPRLADTDGDGLTDWNEVNAHTPCGVVTDPTRNDTDDDGCPDNLDRFLGDGVVEATIMEFKSLQDINGGNIHPIFFVVTYNGNSFCTKRIMDATTNTLYTPGWRYDVDVPETATSVAFDFEAVADDAGFAHDDIKLDAAPGDPCNFHIDYDLTQPNWVGSSQGTMGSLDGDSDAYLKIKLEKQIKQKARTIVINGSDDNGGYGLYEASDGSYRYTADEQLYMIHLNVSDGNSRFQQGINTILLPRAIALACKLNYTLSHLQSIQSTDPLYGASFYYANDSQSLGTSHIRAVISTNLTAAKAETLLYDLTHNSTNARIGNNVTMPTTEALYFLHLPSDVLSSIPSIIVNDGLGPVTNYISLGHEFSNIAQFLFRCLIFVAFGGLLLFTHLADIGMKALGKLINQAQAAVEQAVHKLWNAFMAFVDWAVSMINAIINQIILPIARPILNLVDSSCKQTGAAMENANNDHTSLGKISPRTLNQLGQSLQGNLYWLLFGIGLAASIIFILLKPITLGFSFLIAVAISLVATCIIQNIFNGASIQGEDQIPIPTCTNLAGVDNYISGCGASQFGAQQSGGFGREERLQLLAVIAFAVGMISLQGSEAALAVAIGKGTPGASLISFVSGAISCIYGVWAIFNLNPGISYVGVAFGVLSLITAAVDVSILEPEIMAIIMLFGVLGTAIGIAALIGD
jgi:subtilisin-like proprotein convertase family protein